MKYIYLLFFLSFFNSEATNLKKKQGLSPNILFIIADDMGKDAISGFAEGTIKPKTPYIDQIRNTGLSFTNFWTNPTCSPTRAAIITGKYGNRTLVKKPGDELPSSEKILQQYIKEKTNHTYVSALIGKWHLSGRDRSFNPEVLGIDYFAGIVSGATRSYDEWRLSENGTSTAQSNYITEKFTDLSIDWIKEQQKPWFLWLAYNAPHTPFHVPPAEMHSQGDLKPYERGSRAMPYYLAAIEAMDYQIGRLLNSLSPEVRENTIIIFVGDNGSPRQVAQSPYFSNRVKGSLFQGGINMPLFISGKGVTRSGEDNHLVNHTDLFATISQLAGVGVTEIHDSKSLLPLLTSSEKHRDYVYTDSDDRSMMGYTIRDSQYKLIVLDSGSEKMYDLISDPYESSDLLSSTLTAEQKKAKEALKQKVLEIRGE